MSAPRSIKEARLALTNGAAPRGSGRPQSARERTTDRKGGAPRPTPATEALAPDVASTPGARALAQQLHSFVVSNGGRINCCDHFARFAAQLSATDRASIKEAHTPGVKRGLQSFVSSFPELLHVEVGTGPDAQPMLRAGKPRTEEEAAGAEAGATRASKGGAVKAGLSPAGKSLEHRIFVRRIPFSANVAELQSCFDPFGEVTDVYIPKDYYTGKPKGIAFITFASADGAAAALAAAPHRLGSSTNKLEVTSALPKSGDPPGPPAPKEGGAPAPATAREAPTSARAVAAPRADAAPAAAQTDGATAVDSKTSKSEKSSSESASPEAVRSAQGEAPPVPAAPRPPISMVAMYKADAAARIGLTLSSAHEDEPPRIKAVSDGSLAAAAGSLTPGMLLLAVNGREARGHEEGTALIRAAHCGELVLTVQSDAQTAGGPLPPGLC